MQDDVTKSDALLGTSHQVLSYSQLLLQVFLVPDFKQNEKEEIVPLFSPVLFRADTGNLIY